MHMHPPPPAHAPLAGVSGSFKKIMALGHPMYWSRSRPELINLAGAGADKKGPALAPAEVYI